MFALGLKVGSLASPVFHPCPKMFYNVSCEPTPICVGWLMTGSLIKGIEERIYQQMLFMEAKDQNSLIVLPTGLGKTIVILYLVGYFLQHFPDKKVLVATPTRPLVRQIADTLRDHLKIEEDFVLEVAGSVVPQKRSKLYLDGQVLVGTPQTFSNDFDADRLNPRDFSLLCFDEAHRATGNYAYVKIVQAFTDFNMHPRIIGFTATPGNKPEQIEDVIENLHVRAIRSRFSDDPDVKPYVSHHRPRVEWVNLPEAYKQVIKLLDEYEGEIVEEVKSRGLDPGRYINKRTALDLQKQVTVLMQEDPKIGELLYFVPNLIRVLHLKEMVETQGFPQAASTLAKWFTDPKQKTLRMFLDHPHILNVYQIMTNNPLAHPKLMKLIDFLKDRTTQDTDSKIIVFSNFRDSVDFLAEELNQQGLTCKKFVGQSSQKGSAGMSQKEQLAVLEEFREGELNILISTSVGEEGLDVGSCDLVIFYDSVPSVVRSVQRTGRGRKRQSEVVRLVTRGTKDAALYYAMMKQEKRVQRFIREELPKKMNVDLKIPDPLPHQTSLELGEKKTEKSSTSPSSASLMQFLGRTEQQLLDAQPDEVTSPVPDLLPPENLGPSPTITKQPQPLSKPLPFPETTEDQTLVLVDNREARSKVPRLLKRDPKTKIQLLNLAEGDYRVSEECVVERKTMHDLAVSIIDGRLFEQASQKLTTYKKPILIVEGLEGDVQINVQPAALRGALASLITGFGIPVVRTLDEEETAEMIRAIAKREQRDKRFQPSLQAISKKYPIREIQRFILAAIPGLNRAKADQLLTNFKTIQALANAKPEELLALEGIGKTLTERTLRVLQETADEKDHLE